VPGRAAEVARITAAAMNGAIFDTTFNFFFKFKYAKTFDGMLATPLGVRDIVRCEVTWALLRALGDDAPLLAAPVVDRRLLDHERSLRDFDLQRGVVEVARRPPLEPRCNRLEDASVQPHRVAARAEREPVEVDPRFGLGCHTGIC
jgi:hypothetical protein